MQATRDYIKVLVAGLSTQTGVKIEEGKGWHSSPSERRLIYDMDDLRKLPFGVVRGLLLHELGHIQYSQGLTDNSYIQKYGTKLMGEVYNAYEDHRIERRVIQQFGRYAESAFYEMNAYAAYERLLQMGGDLTQIPLFLQFLLASSLMGLSYHNSDIAGWIGYRGSYLLNEQYAQNLGINLDKRVRDVLLKHAGAIEQMFQDIWRSCPDTAHLQQIVDKYAMPAIEELLQQDPQPKEDQQQQQQQGQGQGQQANPKDGTGKQQPQPGKQPGDGKQPQPSSSFTSALKDEPDGKQQASALGMGGKNQMTQKRVLARPTQREAEALLMPYISTLATRLRDILKEQTATRWHGQYQSGRLLSKNAYKVLLDNESRIFSKRSTPDTPKYTVHLALDSSGSMEGENATYAFLGAVLLRGVCQKLGFTAYIYEYDNTCRVLTNLDEYRGTGGGTYDVVALEQIEKRADPKQSNLVFIVTDGATSRDSEYTELYNKLKKRDALIVGIGIGEGVSRDQMRASYEKVAYVPKVEDLPLELINLMRTIVHR